MTVRQIVLVGDSLTHAGTPNAPQTLVSLGGSGTWAEQVTEGLANIPTVGPLISSGFRSTWMQSGALGSTEWSLSAGWSTMISTSISDRGPYGDGIFTTTGGSTVIATWTRPTRWRAVVGVAIYFMDGSLASAAGNWQYRIDGGTWTNMGQTLLHDGHLCKFYVPTAVSSTVEIRAYTGSAAVGCQIAGIEAFFQNPLMTTTGLIVHNLGRNGAPLNDLTATTTGDRLAFFDSVRVDATNGGGAISNSPNTCVLMMHVNDIRTIDNTTTWAADLATLYARVSPLASLGYMSYGEMNSAGPYPYADQASYRTQTKTSAALHSIPVLDHYDRWTAMGFGSGVGTQNAALVTAGLITVSVSPADNGHQTQRGQNDMAGPIYEFVRKNFFSSFSSYPSSYTATGKQAAVQCAGKQAAVQYAARAPIGVLPT